MTTSDKIIEVLKSVSETDEVQKNLDLPLYDLQILDSLKTVRLIVAISQEFGIDIPPSEFERDRPKFSEHPKLRFVLLVLYYFAIIVVLFVLYGRSGFSTAPFVYQGF
jgi:D-alanine--poly(phosphoribitol) ligase subunit 2